METVDDDPPVDQAGQAHQCHDSRQRAGNDRHEVVDVLGDAGRLGPVLGDPQAHAVARGHEQDAEVEQRGGPAQNPRLVPLGGSARPAELVVAVAPYQARAQEEERHVRQGDPQQVLFEGAHDRGSCDAAR